MYSVIIIHSISLDYALNKFCINFSKKEVRFWIYKFLSDMGFWRIRKDNKKENTAKYELV